MTGRKASTDLLILHPDTTSWPQMEANAPLRDSGVGGLEGRVELRRGFSRKETAEWRAGTGLGG